MPFTIINGAFSILKTSAKTSLNIFRRCDMHEVYIAENLTGLIVIIGLFYDLTKAN